FKLFGMKSIVPSLLIFVVATATASAYYGRKGVKASSVGFRAAFSQAGPMLRLGIYMTAGTAVASLASYIFIAWLRSHAGESGVGIYQAGYVIVSQYVGLVFMALGIEYFPRISRVASSGYRTQVTMRHELTIIMIIMLAASVVFINVAPIVVKILYSVEFTDVVPYLTVATVGTVFKAFSFIMAYVIIARGDGRTYLLTETVSATLFLVISISGWRAGHFLGLGIAYLIWYAFYTISVASVCRFKYGITLRRVDYSLLTAVFMAAGIQAILALNKQLLPSVIFSAAAVAVSGYYLYKLVLKRRTVKE
ncbi:MAG: oligosaccharide flippase family protein, partial [Muribaculaceae bacterium]|nr:oligosaccharide flippase family protein [Muribaculaceae bacterium]